MSKQYGFIKKCPYCGSNVVLRHSNYVYHCDKDYGYLWVCSNFPKCDSYVGCHKGTTIPLGRLADKNLRKAKNHAHREFDKIWKSGIMTRKQLYIWLSAMLDIPQKNCHIGMFDVDMCNRVVEVCKKQHIQSTRENTHRRYKRK